MKAFVSTGALAAALLLAACGGESGGNNKGAGSGGPSGAPVAAPNGGDWTQIVEETPEGGFRMGNPNAPVKLVEYASISCGACAGFAEEASEPLRNRYVKTGRVSWEYRPYMIFPTDPGIFMLLQCRGAQPFFQLTDQLYADQRNWLSKLTPETQQQIAALPQQQQAAAWVRAAGLDQFFQQRGMPAQQISSCLSNQQSLQRLMEITQTGTNQYKVSGTPTFLINDENLELQPGPLWPQVEPALRSAGA